MKRRSFLKLFAYGSVVGLAGYTGVVSFLDQYNIYKDLGLQLPILNDWVSYSIQDIANLQGRQDFKNEQNHSEDNYRISPLLAFCKYQEPTDKMNPSIVVLGSKLPEWHNDFTLVEIASSFEEDYAYIVENHSIINPTEAVLLGNAQSAKTVSTYLHKEKNGFQKQLNRVSYMVKNEKFIFLVILTQSSDGSDRVNNVFQYFTDGFRMS